MRQPTEPAPAPPDRPSALLLALVACAGFASGINGSIAPFLARSFGLDDAGMARLLAWLGLAALAGPLVGRAADRLGRRHALRGCAWALAVSGATTALAPTPGAYLAAQLVAHAAGLALLGLVGVVIAEVLPERSREHGHSIAGGVFTAATGAPLLLAALSAGIADAWRAIWALAALAALVLGVATARLEETPRWREARGSLLPDRGRLLAIFAAPFRARALCAIGAGLLVGAVESCTRVWLLYHQVNGLGVDPLAAAATLAIGGGLGLAGYPAGAALCRRIGRRAAFGVACAAFACALVGYYAGAAHAGALRPFVLFGATFGISAAGGAALVCFRAIAAELLPVTLRGTLAGWLALGSACGWSLAMLCVSLLAPRLGGAGPAVAALGALALPVAAALVAALGETRAAGPAAPKVRAAPPRFAEL